MSGFTTVMLSCEATATRSGEPSSGSITEKRNRLANHGRGQMLRAVASFCLALARGSVERIVGGANR